MAGASTGRAKGKQARMRESVASRGHGNTAKEQRLRTEVVGIETVTNSDQSGKAESLQHANRRDDVDQLIPAVVVRTWENHAPADGGTAYLTNGEVHDPFVVFDTSDWHSVMEHGLCKEGKHPSLASVNLFQAH